MSRHAAPPKLRSGVLAAAKGILDTIEGKIDVAEGDIEPVGAADFGGRASAAGVDDGMRMAHEGQSPKGTQGETLLGPVCERIGCKAVDCLSDGPPCRAALLSRRQRDHERELV